LDILGFPSRSDLMVHHYGKPPELILSAAFICRSFSDFASWGALVGQEMPSYGPNPSEDSLQYPLPGHENFNQCPRPANVLFPPSGKAS
jgi:hypothetical protein